MSTKKSFTTRVLELLKGGDEAKIERFQKKVLKHLKGQIRLCEDAIEKAEEHLIEANEKLSESIYGVNLDAIQTSDSTDDYILIYERNVNNHINNLEKIKKSIEIEKKQIEKINTLISVIEGNV